MKHGPIALINEEMPVVVLIPRDAVFQKTLSTRSPLGAPVHDSTSSSPTCLETRCLHKIDACHPSV